MSDIIKDGGPAFPVHPQCSGQPVGMSLREYAAIKLGVPESGIVWLDDMIRKSQRERFAGTALQGMLAMCAGQHISGSDYPETAAMAYRYADAMLAELEKAP